jgi:hypothetical protein
VCAIAVRIGERMARRDEPIDRPELLDVWPEHPRSADRTLRLR